VSFSLLSPGNSNSDPANFYLYALRERFYSLFPYSWDFITKETPEADWTTIKKYYLTKENLWHKLINPDLLIGLRFGKYTRYTLIDTDRKSLVHPYTDEEAFRRLKEALEDIGLVDPVIVRSSDSEGIHIYYFFNQDMPTFEVACSVRRALEEAGFEIKSGQIELFPNTKQYKKHQKGKRKEFTYYNGHRLPLQKGSYLLDNDFVPYSNKIEHLLEDAEASAQSNDCDLLTSTLKEAKIWFKQKYRSYPNKTNNANYQDWFNNTTRRINEGWTEHHQTNDFLIVIANLGVKAHHLQGKELATFIQDTAVAASGYYPYCRHRHEIKQRSRDVARAAEKYWSAYASHPKRSFTYAEMLARLEERANKPNLNQVKSEQATDRIRQTVQTLTQTLATLPRTIKELMKLIRETAKNLFGISVSDKTLRKEDNLALWHPQYNKDKFDTIDLEVKEPVSKEVFQKESTEVLFNESASTPPVTIESPVKPQELEQSAALQGSLQPEPLINNQPSNGAIPCKVVCKNPLKSESLQVISGKCLSNRGYTLPFMKGFMRVRVAQIIFQLLQRVYCEALMQTPELVIEYQGFQGNGTSGLVEIEKHKQPVLQTISTNSKVKIISDSFHSSYFRENPQQILVYVKPLYSAEKWLSGIAVLLENLFPVQIL
jgi:hypothetical protein